MPNFKLLITKKVAKQIKQLSEKLRLKTLKSLAAIELDPYLGKKLQGKLKNYYSYKAWPLRIIYRIYRNRLEILIVAVGQREGIY